MASIVYLDVCCLKRPFDDQRSARIQVETAAVAALIARAEGGAIRLVRSPAHAFAEESGAVWLATTDDRMITLGQRHAARLRVKVANPTRLLQELTGGET